MSAKSYYLARFDKASLRLFRSDWDCYTHEKADRVSIGRTRLRLPLRGLAGGGRSTGLWARADCKCNRIVQLNRRARLCRRVFWP